MAKRKPRRSGADPSLLVFVNALRDVLDLAPLGGEVYHKVDRRFFYRQPHHAFEGRQLAKRGAS